MIGERLVLKAPGKVLMAGGYGVLEEQNVGLSLAVDRYFYSVSSRVDSEKEEEMIEVDVSSPQIGQKWAYRFNTTKHCIQEEKGQNNLFLQNAIFFTLEYCKRIGAIKVKSIATVILQDRGFLSQKDKAQEGAKFINYSEGATKTGLGSSAGVIVVTVGAILRQITGVNSTKTVNALCQVANLAAQNKIGSNFDISTAVHGSHLYRNVLPKLAFEVISSLDFETLMHIDPIVNPLHLPSKTLINGYACMIDLKQGSNTRKMVSGFIKSLNEKDQNSIKHFYQKSKEYVLAIYTLITEQSIPDEAIEKGLKKINRQYRSFLQYYSSITSIPVEPPEFKPFLDELTNINKVIYAICPGSGGYDAIFVLTTANTPQEIISLKQQVDQILSQHNLQANINDIKIVWGQAQVSQGQLDEIEKYLQ